MEDINIYNTAIFTGYQDVDTEILTNLSDEQLQVTCMVNSYAHQLCKNSHELTFRLNNLRYFNHLKQTRFIKHKRHLDFQTEGKHPKTTRPVIIEGRLYNAIMNDYKYGKLNNYY